MVERHSPCIRHDSVGIAVNDADGHRQLPQARTEIGVDVGAIISHLTGEVAAEILVAYLRQHLLQSLTAFFESLSRADDRRCSCRRRHAQERFTL